MYHPMLLFLLLSVARPSHNNLLGELVIVTLNVEKQVNDISINVVV